MTVDYSRRAADYDRIRGDEATDREFWLRGIVEVGRVRPRERVLDLGAGTGRFASLLSATSPVVAFDASREMLHVARAKSRFECVLGDGHRLPFRADSFDVTMIVMVLQHLADDFVAVDAFGFGLRQVARVSRRLVLATSDMATRRLGILEEAFPTLLEVDRKRFPPIGRIVTALKDAGFANVEVEERRYVRALTPEQQLDRVRRKYLSTFDLIPPDEYERGLRFLEVELPRRYPRGFEIAASFTFLGATR